MRKIVITGMAAALALSATACNVSVDTKPAAAPPATSAPATSAPAPTGTPGTTSTPGTPSSPRVKPTAATPQGGQQIRSKWGRLRYLAPGKFTVGNVVFFTATDTTVVVAGGTCPDGSAPAAEDSKCGVEGLEEWAKAAPHNVNVLFSGQTATLIQETQ